MSVAGFHGSANKHARDCRTLIAYSKVVNAATLQALCDANLEIKTPTANQPNYYVHLSVYVYVCVTTASILPHIIVLVMSWIRIMVRIHRFG